MNAKKTQRLGEISPVTEKLSEQALIDELAAFDRYECISVELDPFGRRAVSAHTVVDSFEVERVGALLAKIFYNSDTGSSLTIFSEIACAEKAVARGRGDDSFQYRLTLKDSGKTLFILAGKRRESEVF